MPSKYDFPAMPASPTAPTYENIIRTLRAPTPTMSQFLPEMRETLGARSEFIEPQIQSALADVMGAAERRGLTGGSIEMGTLGATAGGMRAQFAAQTAGQWADILFKARQGDVNAQRQIQIAISQAMGQEMTAQRSMEMFQRQLEEMMAASGRAAKAGLWGAGIGAAGAIGGGALAGWGSAVGSDRRLKEHIEVLEDVDGIEVVAFRWNVEAQRLGYPAGQRQIGVIAQQALEHAPRAVYKYGDFYRVDYERLPGTVQHAIARHRQGVLSHA